MKKERNEILTQVPMYACSDQIIGNPNTQMKAVKSPTPQEIRAKATHDLCGKKVNALVLEYLRVAKDDSLGAKYFFDKYNNEWKVFATIKNKQQRDIIVNLDAFEKRIEYMLKMADKQIQDENETQNTDEAI